MKKAFTLIELLAVIIILAVIALITAPIVLNVVEDARKKAFQETAHGIMDAASYQYLESNLKGTTQNKMYTFPTNELTFKGEKPKGGQVYVNDENQIAIAIYNDKWCVYKGLNQREVTLIDYEEGNCELTDDGELVINSGETGGKQNTYKTKVIKSYTVNQEKCVEFIKSSNFTFNSNPTKSEIPYIELYAKGICDNTVKIQGILTLEEMLLLDHDISPIIEEGIIENVEYETKNQSCFITIPEVSWDTGYAFILNNLNVVPEGFEFNINYNQCKAVWDYLFSDTSKTAPSEEDIELFCLGKETSDGLSFTKLFENLNSDDEDTRFTAIALIPFIDAGVIEAKRDMNHVGIVGYRCYKDNEFNMPEILDVEIPSTIGNKPVTQIFDAFYANQLTSVTIPNSINYISGESFFDNPNLTSITIDNTEGSIEGSPWGAENATITYLR